MLDVQKLREMCMPPVEGKAYFRPFICRGDISRTDIFLVGINPATQIYPKDMKLEDYVDMLLDYDKFMEFYKFSRRAKGKDEISRTRLGMKAFIEWLTSRTESSILETDIITYPTENLKQLKKEPKEIIERGKKIFHELMMELQPGVLILHGKKTVEYAFEVLLTNGLIEGNEVDLDVSIEDMEVRGPLFEFKYPGGKVCSVMACRHFMYYGKSGESFREFRERVLDVVER